MNYEPDCGDCPTPDECKAKNDCQIMRQIRHGNIWGVPQGEPTKAWTIMVERVRQSAGNTIHILHAGLPCCGFDPRAPAEWPEGNIWVSVEGAKTILPTGGDRMCEWCARVARLINQLESLGRGDKHG